MNRLIATAMMALILTGGRFAAAETPQPHPVEGTIEVFLGEAAFEAETLFEGGRFPTVAVAMDGTVLAFWDGVVVRRSEDGGVTWGDPITVGEGFMGGGMTVDEATGHVFAFVEQGHPPCPLTVYRSEDHGKTWAEHAIKIHGNADGHVPSMHMNEHGITLRHGRYRGRLIRPSRWYGEANRPPKHWPTHYTNALYSDDNGGTWRASAPFPEMGTGEACIVELADGVLYYNTRRHWAPAPEDTKSRWYAWSHDGGATWTGHRKSTVLPDGNQDTEYGLMGGLVRLPVLGRDVLVFSNVESDDGRKNGVVWASFDGGHTWPLKRVVDPGSFAYSSLNAGRPGTAGEGWIYLLYETGGHPNSTGKMARFNLSWLLGGEATGDGALPRWAEIARTDGAGAGGPARLRVMSFNLWHGGERGWQPLAKTAAVIRASQADIVGIQEGAGLERADGTKPDNTLVLADMLGWHHASQDGGRAVISRFPIMGATPGRQGVEIVVPPGERLFVFNIHFPASPYQPYQLLNIDYGDAPFLETAEELVAAAEAARGNELTALLAELRPRVEAGDYVLLTGDFNEPSHEDWTAAAAAAGVVPMAVEFPTTRRILGAGMTDAYRAMYPDPVRHPGWTWTPTTEEDDPEDRHDRIDMVFTGPGIRTLDVEITGERRERASIVIHPYPSDHRAVTALVALSKPPAAVTPE